jgi:hypothetical protein
MQRLHQIDQEMITLIDAIRNMVPLSTQFGTQGINLAMGDTVEMAIQSLAELHRYKMEILRNMNRENENPYRTPERPYRPLNQVPMPLAELEEQDDPRFFIRQPIQFAEMNSWNNEEDEGPMQLADLMDTDESPISQVATPEHVQHQDGIDWGAQVIDGVWPIWTDAQPENLPSEEDDTPIHQNITVRQVSRPTCVRKMVYSVEPHQLRELSENDCNVCFEKQIMIDTCVTSCKHHFCKGCFVQWENTCGGVVTCPTCRTARPIVTEYRSRSVV